jgi:hypothetical protein
MEWIEKYPKKNKPAYEELLAFLPDSVRGLFLTFNGEMAEKYKVYNNYPRFENTTGWTYGYCRGYRIELLYVTVGNSCFTVLGVMVQDEKSLNDALEKVRIKYDAGYEARYARLTAAKKAGQIERSKTRLEREKSELAKMAENIDPAKFNKCKWSEKVSRNKLIRLYQNDAKGLTDVDLLDEVGYTLYARCKQAKETRECLDKGEIICCHCGTVNKAAGYASLISCPCGYYYTYREYRRSCNANSMPGGRATEIFYAFAQKWPLCKDEKEKMLLIDWLVHECHVSVMTGGQGRSVCVNLIEGTVTQIKNMLEMLAGE